MLSRSRGSAPLCWKCGPLGRHHRQGSHCFKFRPAGEEAGQFVPDVQTSGLKPWKASIYTFLPYLQVQGWHAELVPEVEARLEEKCKWLAGVFEYSGEPPWNAGPASTLMHQHSGPSSSLPRKQTHRWWNYASVKLRKLAA